MYIRWKTKRLMAKTGEQDRSLYAVLVESARREGKPRQKVIKHLAYINERNLGAPEHQKRFWAQAQGALATIAIDSELMRKLQEKLRERVPCPVEIEHCFETNTLMASPSMMPQFEHMIDWSREVYHVPGKMIVVHGRDEHQYLIPQNTFNLLNPVTRTRLLTLITMKLVRESLNSIRRVGALSKRGKANGSDEPEWRRTREQRCRSTAERIENLAERIKTLRAEKMLESN